MWADTNPSFTLSLLHVEHGRWVGVVVFIFFVLLFIFKTKPQKKSTKRQEAQSILRLGFGVGEGIDCVSVGVRGCVLLLGAWLCVLYKDTRCVNHNLEPLGAEWYA